jgi:SOS-response transcriptional repressor LexA
LVVNRFWVFAVDKTWNPSLELFAERMQSVVGSERSIAEVARKTGIPVNTLSRMLGGKNEPGVFNVAIFCRTMGVSMEWLVGLTDDPELTRFGWKTPDLITVPILDVRAAAGPGSHVDVVQAEAEFTIPHYFLTRLLGDRAGRAKLTCLRAKGESMEPTISDGALLIIDETQNKLPIRPGLRLSKHEPDIFVFFTSDGLRLKRLRRVDDDFIAIMSDNERLHPIEMFRLNRDGALKIIGKVVWWDNRL